MAQKLVHKSLPFKAALVKDASTSIPYCYSGVEREIAILGARDISLVLVKPNVPILTILDILERSSRFALDRKILKKYATYKLNSNLKILIAAKRCDTITLVLFGYNLFC